MWIILLVSPTPGGSGIAEFVFSDFLGDFYSKRSWYAPLAVFLEINFILSVSYNWSNNITYLVEKSF